jgi:hypothetical protein
MINDKLEFEANKFFVEQTLGDSFLMSDEEIINFIEACDFNIHKLRQVLDTNKEDARNTIYGIEIFIKSMGCRLLNVNRAGRLIQGKTCD